MRAARPTQCRTFPWWPQNLISDYDWQLAARECEGITLPREDGKDLLPDTADPRAPVYSFDDILPEVILHDVRDPVSGCHHLCRLAGWTISLISCR